MAAKPLSRHTKLATAVPVVLVSGLWTAQLVLAGSGAVAKDSTRSPLPDGTSVPAEAITAPASIPVAGTLGIAVPEDRADQVIADATNSGIPAPALAAYQRAAQVVSQADNRCNLPWALLAAIGRAESDHGQHDNNRLNDHGESRPGVYGPMLNGADGSQLVEDSDGGRLDQDAVYDRGVGGMQIVPSTWLLVRADGDGDGKRDPQNINDAALGAAVHLCSGDDNLGTRSGKQAAVFRYHPEQNYVNLVLRIMEAYQTGDFSAMPTSNWGGKTYTPNQESKPPREEFEENQGTRPRAEKQRQTSPNDSPESRPDQTPQDQTPNNPPQQNLRPTPPDTSNPPPTPEPSQAPQPEQANPQPQEPEQPTPTPPTPSPSPEPPTPSQLSEPESGPADGPGDGPGGEPTSAPEPSEPEASAPVTEEPTEAPSEAPGGDNGDPGDQGSGDDGAGDGDGPGDSEGPGDSDGPGDGSGDTGTDTGPELPTDPPTETQGPEPSVEPTPEPTIEPTPEPTYEPTPEPTEEPTEEPTIEPTPEPTEPSSPSPTKDPWADWWQFLADVQDCWDQVPSGPADDNWWICMGNKGYQGAP